MMKTAMALAALMVTAGVAQAADYDIGPIHVSQVWARATPKGAQVGAGYLTVRNTGPAADTLTCVSMALAQSCEIHTMAEQNGMMTMRPMADGLTIKPGETVTLKPGGLHMMFVGLSSPLERGKPVKASLKFEKAGTIEVEFAVAPPGAPGPEMQGSGHGH